MKDDYLIWFFKSRDTYQAFEEIFESALTAETTDSIEIRKLEILKEEFFHRYEKLTNLGRNIV